MKLSLLLLTLLTAICFTAPAFAAPGEDTAGQHPRLFFSADDVPALREKIKAEPYASMVKQLLHDVENTGDRSGSEYDPTRGYDQTVRAQRAGFAYVLTGDEKYARIAREGVEAILGNAKEWANPGAKGLALYWHGARVASAYDFCYSSEAWDDAFNARVSSELKRHGDVIFQKGGREQNTSPASNWQGARFGSAGLCYLATDEAVDDASIDNAYGRVKRFLQANLGGAKSSGWNTEGLGYNYYPMGNFVGPFTIAMANVRGQDIRKDVPQVSASYWSVYATYVPTMGGIRPDFGDDNPGTDAEGTLGQAFYFCNDALKPGLAYLYPRIEGKEGRGTWDATRGGTIWSILYHPGDSIQPVNPMEIPAWTELFVDRGGHGMFTYRNGYLSEDDIVAQFFVKRNAPGGHSGPDALSFRIIGLGTGFAVGGGRYGPKIDGRDAYKASMNTLYPVDPEKPEKTSNSTGKVVGEPVLHDDGSGSVVASAGINNVGTKDLTRRFFSSFDPAASAAATFVISDTSSNGQFWQMVTVEPNKVETTADGFLITSPEGATLKGTVLYPASNLRTATGTRIRGSDFNQFKNNNYVHFQADDGDYLVVLTLQPAGKSHPAVTATGTFAGDSPAGEVKVGGLTVEINGDAISAK